MYAFIALLVFLQVIVAAPLPLLVTRYHTAAAITSTETYITGTTTVWLPPVEIFISNGVTYTFTNYEGQWATTQATTTSVLNDATTTSPAGQATPTVEAQTTTGAETIQNGETAQNTQNAQNSQTATTTSPATTAATQNGQNTQNTQNTQNVQNAQNTQNGEGQTMTTQTPSSATIAQQATTPATSTANGNNNGNNETGTTANGSTQGNTQATQATTKASSAPANAETNRETATTGTATSTTSAGSTTSPTSPTSPTSSSAASSSASGSLSPPSVIVYSPYNNDNSCKDWDSIEADLKVVKSKGINKIRLYGADCAVTTAVLPLCKQLGITVNQGFWISPEGVDSIDGYVSSVVSWAQTNGWDVFDFFTIGNEAVNENYCTVSELISKIASVKSILNKAGYSGKVTTSEPPVSFINNPSLCTESVIDFVGVNPHSYFNQNLYAYQAGEYVTSQQSQVAKVCSKSTVITETGYPHQGDVNGNNVPSPANQLIALQSIMKATGGDVTILTMYDDFWKQPGQYGIEQYFGMIELVQG